MPIVSMTQHSLSLADVGTRVRITLNTASPPFQVTVPQEASVTWPDGAWIEVVHSGGMAPASFDVVGELGVTLNQFSGTSTLTPGQMARLTKVSGAADLWDLHVYRFVPNGTEYGQVLKSSSTGRMFWETITSVPDSKPPLNIMNASASAFDIGNAFDHHTLYRCQSAGTQQLTVQPDSFWVDADPYYGSLANTSPMPDGGMILIGKVGPGDVTLVPGVGVTINTPDTLTISKAHGKATLIKVGPDEWDLEGNIGL